MSELVSALVNLLGWCLGLGAFSIGVTCDAPKYAAILAVVFGAIALADIVAIIILGLHT